MVILNGLPAPDATFMMFPPDPPLSLPINSSPNIVPQITPFCSYIINILY